MLIVRNGIGKVENGEKEKDERGLAMPKAKKKLTQTEQSKRFVETAKALEADESGKSFEKVISTIFPKPKAQPKSRGGS